GQKTPTTAPAATVPSAPTTQSAAREKDIRAMEAYYARIYGEPLKSTERLPREIAIISLSRVLAPETTDKLLSVFDNKGFDPVIGYLAWEALHARQSTLADDQRMEWFKGGLLTAGAGGFPGSSVTPLLH